MSRIGKRTIEIPKNVEVIIDQNLVRVKGPKGELEIRIRSAILVEKKENQIIVKKARKDKFAQNLWGLTRTLINNMIIGVTEGFEKKLEFSGVGYRAQVEKENDKEKLVLNMGFSHPKELVAPKGINFKVEKNTIIIIGTDKELVGNVAAKIRKVRPPEPYKGKGIKYIDEQIRRKEGKAIAKTEGVE